MAKVENMAFATAHGLENGPRFLGDHFRRGVAEQRGRQIALKGDVRGQKPARVGQRKLPVNPQHAGPGRQQVIPIPVRAEGENNDRRSADLRIGVLEFTL